MTDEKFEQIKTEVFGEPVKQAEPKCDPRFTERSDNPTPNGGDYSIAYYYNEEGMPCEKKEASLVNRIEYKKGGIRIGEHYASLR